MKILHFDEIGSTNDYCKSHDDGEDMIVTADRQTAGRGTKGRSFVSGGGGVYVTVMRHYPRVAPENAFQIMIGSCVAVCRTVERFGVRPQIRWANDVLVNGKKICGTLIENVFGGGKIVRSVVGIGLNVNNVLPPELGDIATTLSLALGRELNVDEVRGALVENLGGGYTVEAYKSYIGWLGQNVTLKTDAGEFIATALDVEPDGRLLCRINGETKKISSAEVSLRLHG